MGNSAARCSECGCSERAKELYQTVLADGAPGPGGGPPPASASAARPPRARGHHTIAGLGGRSGRVRGGRSPAPAVHGVQDERKCREPTGAREHHLGDVRHQEPSAARHREVKRCDSRGSSSTNMYGSCSGEDSMHDTESSAESRMGRVERHHPTECGSRPAGGARMEEVLEEADQALEHRSEQLPDGSVFEGQFRGGERHGRGKFTWGDGWSYAGQFDANDMHGEGTYTWSDGSTFYGQWRRNEMGPDGVMEWPDGRKYCGQFLGGKKHGEGRLTWPDGRSYEGQWEAGRQHGTGTAVTEAGLARRGRWEHGRPVAPFPTPPRAA